MSMSPMEVAGKPVEDEIPTNSIKSSTFDSNSYGETAVSKKSYLYISSTLFFLSGRATSISI